MLWIGIDERPKIAIIFIGTFFQLVLMAAEDVSPRADAQIGTGADHGGGAGRDPLAGGPGIAKPALLETLRVTMGWAWTYLVVAELVAAIPAWVRPISRRSASLRPTRSSAGYCLSADRSSPRTRHSAPCTARLSWLHTK